MTSYMPKSWSFSVDEIDVDQQLTEVLNCPDLLSLSHAKPLRWNPTLIILGIQLGLSEGALHPSIRKLLQGFLVNCMCYFFVTGNPPAGSVYHLTCPHCWLLQLLYRNLSRPQLGRKRPRLRHCAAWPAHQKAHRHLPVLRLPFLWKVKGACQPTLSWHPHSGTLWVLLPGQQAQLPSVKISWVA